MTDQTTTPAEVIARIPIAWDGDTPTEFLVDAADADVIVEALTEAGFLRPLPDEEQRREVGTLVDHLRGDYVVRERVHEAADLLAAAFLTEESQG